MISVKIIQFDSFGCIRFFSFSFFTSQKVILGVFSYMFCIALVFFIVFSIVFLLCFQLCFSLFLTCVFNCVFNCVFSLYLL